MRNEIRDISFSILLIGLSIGGIFLANQFQTDALYGPDFFPKLILYILIFCSVLLLIKVIINYKKNSVHVSFNKVTGIKITAFIILLIIYINLFFWIGFIFSTIIFLLIAQYIFGMRKYIQLILISVAVPILLHFIFSYLFQIPLP